MSRGRRGSTVNLGKKGHGLFLLNREAEKEKISTTTPDYD